MLTGAVITARVEPASVEEGGAARFEVVATFEENVTTHQEIPVPYTFPVTGPDAGTAMPSPAPDGAQSDHSGQARDGYVIVHVLPGTKTGFEVVNVATVRDNVAEGNETAVFLTSGGVRADLTITDAYTQPPPPPPPPSGGGGGTGSNRPPVVSDGSKTVAEDALLGTDTVTGTYSDPDGDPVNCSATGLLQGETFAAENGVWTWTFSRADGPRSRTINISAYSNGGSDTATATATVTNVIPNLTALTVDAATIDENDSTTLRGDFRDPGADTFTLRIDWDGNGSWDEVVPLGSQRYFARTHVYLDDDPTDTASDVKNIRAMVTDDDQESAGGVPSSSSGQSAVNVRVNNVDPSNVTARATNPIVEGGRAIVEAGDSTYPFKGDGSFFDPGTQDTWSTSTIDYGDQTPEVPLVIKAGQTFDIPAHVYAEPGLYTATINVRDDDRGAAATKEIAVTVVRLVALRAEEYASGGAVVEAHDRTARDMYVAERRASGDAQIRLFDLVLPVATPHGRILYAVSGNNAAPASGNFAVPPTDVTLTPTGGNRAYTVKAGFDNNANGTLESTETDRTINVYVVRVDLTASNVLLPLLRDNTYTTTVHSGGPAAVTDYRTKISRMARADWYVLGMGQQFTRRARVAGWFDVRSFATIAGRAFESNTISFGARFPTYDEIVADAAVRGATDAAWANTLAATTPTSRREEGFWIRLNTADERYEFTTTVVQDPPSGPRDTASVELGDPPVDSPSNPPPVSNATYTVASFHTHTPSTYRTGSRRVGPTSTDQSLDAQQDVVGVVYDYVGDAAGYIHAGHALSDPARRYHSGPDRRATP